MKIGNKIMEPQKQYTFDEIGYHAVYYYYESYSIDLGNMFEYIENLVGFPFNDDNINNYYISDIRGMFQGCSSLQYISLAHFKGYFIII